MDYAHPDYLEEFERRHENLVRIKADPAFLAASKIHYKDAPWKFITDWGFTYEPRNPGTDMVLANIPFVLWDKQIEFLEWLQDKWQNLERNPRPPNELTSGIRDRILKAHKQRLHPPADIPEM